MRAALAPWLQGKLMGRNDFEGFSSGARLRAAREGSRARAARRASAPARDRGPAARAALPALGVPRDPGASGRDAAGLALRRRRLPRAAPASDARRLRDLGARRVHGGERRHAADPAQPPLGRRRAAAGRRGGRVDLHARGLGRRVRRQRSCTAAARAAAAGHASVSRRSTASPGCASSRTWRSPSRPTAARRLSPRVQELLGYSIAEPSFMGYVNGLHPKRLLDPDYAAEEESEGDARPEPRRRSSAPPARTGWAGAGAEVERRPRAGAESSAAARRRRRSRQRGRAMERRRPPAPCRARGATSRAGAAVQASPRRSSHTATEPPPGSSRPPRPPVPIEGRSAGDAEASAFP